MSVEDEDLRQTIRRLLAFKSDPTKVKACLLAVDQAITGFTNGEVCDALAMCFELKAWDTRKDPYLYELMRQFIYEYLVTLAKAIRVQTADRFPKALDATQAPTSPPPKEGDLPS